MFILRYIKKKNTAKYGYVNRMKCKPESIYKYITV